jgi:hypothetical protein
MTDCKSKMKQRERSGILGVLALFASLLTACNSDAGTSTNWTLHQATAQPIVGTFHKLSDKTPSSGTTSSDSLYPLFPNPFSRAGGDTSITVQFSLKDTSSAIVLIQNAIGDEIARFRDSTLPSGSYVGSWLPLQSDGSSLNSGFYFITLRVNDTIAHTSYINSRLLNILNND